MRRELYPTEEQERATLAHGAQSRELDVSGTFYVPVQGKGGGPPEAAADTRWPLTWEMAKARLVAQSYQDPDFKEGQVETPSGVYDLLT